MRMHFIEERKFLRNLSNIDEVYVYNLFIIKFSGINLSGRNLLHGSLY